MRILKGLILLTLNMLIIYEIIVFAVMLSQIENWFLDCIPYNVVKFFYLKLNLLKKYCLLQMVMKI